MKATPTIRQQIEDMLATLSPQSQAKVLAFVQATARAEANAVASPAAGPASGQDLLDFFDKYPLTAEEAAELARIYQEIGE